MQIENNNVVQATDQNFEALRMSSGVLLLDFGAQWCSACKMMETVLAEIGNDFAGAATVAKVDVEDNMTLTSQYGIRNIPALLLFKDGVLVKRYSGFTHKSVLSRELSSFVTVKDSIE